MKNISLSTEYLCKKFYLTGFCLIGALFLFSLNVCICTRVLLSMIYISLQLCDFDYIVSSLGAVFDDAPCTLQNALLSLIFTVLKDWVHNEEFIYVLNFSPKAKPLDHVSWNNILNVLSIICIFVTSLGWHKRRLRRWEMYSSK